MSTKQLLLVLAILIITTMAWKQGSATKPNQRGFNQAYRINSQLDQWQKSHIIPQSDPNTENDPNLAKFKRQIFEERKKFAQQWVEKKNNQSLDDDQEKVQYYVDSAGRVQYKSHKKTKKETVVDL